MCFAWQILRRNNVSWQTAKIADADCFRITFSESFEFLEKIAHTFSSDTKL